MATMGTEWAKAMAKKMGLKLNTIQKLTVIFETNEVVRVTAVLFPPDLETPPDEYEFVLVRHSVGKRIDGPHA